ncbi:hypothetical protein HN935_01985 [archaeon]|nr:hypothetical protein [archaeon]
MVIKEMIGVVALVCAIWVIYDVLVNNKQKSTEWKVVWVVLAIVFSIITAIVYYFINKQ